MNSGRLQNSLASSNSFFMASLGFPIYSLMLSAISDSFSFSFLIWIPFISFSNVITMTGTSNTMLYEIVLFLILAEMLSAFNHVC